MSPPRASPRASCLSVNTGENCVLIKLSDPNVDLDFPKVIQNIINIIEIEIIGSDKLWKENSGPPKFSYTYHMYIDLGICL